MSGLQLTWVRRGERHPGCQPLLTVKDLVVRVGLRRVLNGIGLEVYPGDHLQITGPNGCGKSTLLNAVAGVEPARIERGCIRFDGEDMTKWPAYERARRGIIYMRQVDHVFPTLTVSENLTLALGRDGYERFREAFPEWIVDFPSHKQTGQLSGGQRKKLAWGMTVLGRAPLVLADEPEAGVAQRFDPPEAKTYIKVTHQ